MWCVSSLSFITASKSGGERTFLAFKRAGTSDNFSIIAASGEDGDASLEILRQYRELANPEPYENMTARLPATSEGWLLNGQEKESLTCKFNYILK